MEIGGADTDKCSHRTGYITGRHQLYVIIKPRPSGRGLIVLYLSPAVGVFHSLKSGALPSTLIKVPVPTAVSGVLFL